MSGLRCPQEKIVFGVVSSKNDNRCPRKSGLSSLYLSLVKTIIGVPGKVVYLHYTTVYCAYLSVVLVAFRSGRNSDGYLVGKELVILLFVCCRKMFCCVLCIFFATWCLCWDFKFNCTDSWSIYSYLTIYVLDQKIRKLCIPLQTPVLLYKSVV